MNHKNRVIGTPNLNPVGYPPAMFSTFLLASVIACNSKAPAQGVAVEPSAMPGETPEEQLDQGRESQSVIEIPNPRFNVRHILVAHAEATGANDAISRDRNDAQRIATEILQELNDGADFETLAKTRSDDGSASRGGALGVFTSGVMHRDFEAAVVGLDVGARSAVIETPFGFHIIERLPVVEVHLAHILIQWAGVKRTRSQRTRAEAEERAQQALSMLSNGTPFAEVATALSDGPFGPRGGDLGWFQKGQMAPQFDEVAFALEPKERSGVVESTHGLHIILRLE